MGAAEIALDDVVVVKPGGRLPVDGVVVAGHSFVDQATSSSCRNSRNWSLDAIY